LNDIFFSYKVLCQYPFTGYTPDILHQMPLYQLIDLYNDYRQMACPEDVPENYEYHGPISGRKPTQPLLYQAKTNLGERKNG